MSATISFNENQLTCHGEWTKWHAHTLQSQFAKQDLAATSTVTVDGSHLSALDTAGAVLLLQSLKPMIAAGQVAWRGFSESHQALLELLLAQNLEAYKPVPESESYFTIIGENAVYCVDELRRFLIYTGENSLLALRCLTGRGKVRWRMVAHGIQVTGYDAMPIVALLSFLIGVVLAYQLGHQLATYGANIYVVDISAMAILREFAPLITAIILAGRTGSSYAAQIGTMMLNEEVDAIRTLGLSAQEMLVLPKLMALMISLPLLSVLADMFGVFGSMFMSKVMLDISYVDFIRRFGNVVEMKVFLVGMVKTPFYALIISSIGCFHGLQVKGGASSIGYRTTVSVVHSIFIIIVADAGFSVLFSALGL